MKKYLTIIAAAAICLLTACSKEKELRAPAEVVAEESNTEFTHLPGWTYIGAGNGEVATAASIDDATAAFSWNTGDKIAIWVGDSYKVSAALDASFDGSANAEFAFEGEDIDANRADFAVYPASLVYNGTDIIPECLDDHTASALTIVLPGSYTLAQVQNNVSPTPMIAVNTPGNGLSFKSICALLRITVKYIPKDAHTLKISFPGKKVQGFFTLNNFTAGTDGVVLDDATGDDDSDIVITDLGISAFTESLVINIPVPMGVASSQEYKYVRVAAYDKFNTYSHVINSIDTPIKVVESAPVSWTPGRKASRKVTANLPYFTVNQKINKRVVFAPGNLQADLVTVPTADAPIGAANNWRFAQHQYETIGATAANRFQAGSEGGAIDLFSFIGESATYEFADNEKYGVQHANKRSVERNGQETGESIKYSWAELFNGVSYPAGTWRLLSSAKLDGDTQSESTRAVCQRDGSFTTNGYVSAKAIILKENGTDTLAKGLVIFPDKYVHPYGVKAINKYSHSTHSASHYNENILTFEEWELMEKVGGCAFLPVTSVRYGSGNTLTQYAGSAAYWADVTLSTDHGSGIEISDTYYGTKTLAGKTAITASKSTQRQYGLGVRLVRDVN